MRGRNEYENSRLEPHNGLDEGSGLRAVRGAGHRGLGRFRLAVDQFLELLARLEVRHLLRRDVHLVAGLRIAAFPRLALSQPEAAEPTQLDLLAAMQRLDNAP